MAFGSPGPYPIPAIGGPQYIKFRQFVPSYDEMVDEHEYDDGGASYVLRNDVAPIIFLFEYPGNIDENEVGILDDHRADAFGKAFGFDLTDPRTGDEFENVHYLDSKDDHEKVWMQQRTVRLIWRPV